MWFRRISISRLIACTIAISVFITMILIRWAHRFEGNVIVDRELADKVTIVTAYIDIGEYKTNDGWTYYSPELYKKWLKAFAHIKNPVTAYFDTVENAEYFEEIRKHLGAEMTRTQVIEKLHIWSFSLLPEIEEIFEKPFAHRSLPDTLIPEYACAVNAKYEFAYLAAYENLFQTKYIAWVDVAYFRDDPPTEHSPLEIYLPPNFDDKKIAYGEIQPRDPNAKLTEIFFKNLEWVDGGFFIGADNMMQDWAEDYMNTADYIIRERQMAGTDKQTLYAIYNSNLRTGENIPMQPYPSIKGDPQTYLGYQCRVKG